MSHRRIIIYHVRARMGLEQSKEKLHRGAPVTLVALGDSLTSGWMVRKGYLEYLTEMIEQAYPSARLTIINRGIPGDTADNGRVRVYSDVIAHKPDLVFIQFALNDAVMGYSPQQLHQHDQYFRDTGRMPGRDTVDNLGLPDVPPGK